MALDMRQAVVEGGCTHCGGKVVLRWARTSAHPRDGEDGFAHARCTSCGRSWYAADYRSCPVEESGTPAQALARLQGMCAWSGK